MNSSYLERIGVEIGRMSDKLETIEPKIAEEQMKTLIECVTRPDGSLVKKALSEAAEILFPDNPETQGSYANGNLVLSPTTILSADELESLKATLRKMGEIIFPKKERGMKRNFVEEVL